MQIKPCSRGFSRAARPKFEAFHGLPGRRVNHLTNPFKMDLQLTNHHFNFDKFRVSMRVTVKHSEGHASITWIGVAYLMKAG